MIKAPEKNEALKKACMYFEHSNMSDREIAKLVGRSPCTVRIYREWYREEQMLTSVERQLTGIKKTPWPTVRTPSGVRFGDETYVKTDSIWA